MSDSDQKYGATPESAELRAKCPICGRAPAPPFRPFCSRRCSDVDLARWFSDAYLIAGESDDATDRDD